jgi:phage-related baseplate assembly protein
MRADELVIGLSIDGESKAYGTYILSAHEIVNDAVGGIPIAITW